jgi:hypothetical protein
MTLVSVFVDDNPTMAVARGFLALQMEGRDIWLKNLP